MGRKFFFPLLVYGKEKAFRIAFFVVFRNILAAEYLREQTIIADFYYLHFSAAMSFFSVSLFTFSRPIL